MICVLDNPEAANQFQTSVKLLTYDYQVQSVNTKEFPGTECHVAYFSNTSPQQQQSLIQSYPSRYLLSLSTNNPACEIEGLLASCKEPLDFNGEIIHFGFSLGIAFSQYAENPEDLVMQADQAMYKAKNLIPHWFLYKPEI